MEQSKADIPQDVDAIQNLDTARMALRWALERLQKLEKDKTELGEKVSSGDKARSRAQEEIAALERALALRAEEANQRELYYAKLEQFLSLRLEGKLDPAALAKRELELSQLQELLQQKLAHLEKDFAARKAALEREQADLRSQLQQETRAAAKKGDQSVELRRASLEDDYLSKMAELHERQISVQQETRTLAERKAQFEDYSAAQRAQLQAEMRNFQEESKGEVQFRLEIAERLLSERQASMEAAWSREKALLLKELDSWRRKAQELVLRLHELDGSLAAAEEGAKQSRSAANRLTLTHAEREKAWESEKAALESDLQALKEKSRLQASESLELKRRLSQAEQGGLPAERFAALEAAWQEERKALLAELEHRKRGLEDQLRRGLETERRVAEAATAEMRARSLEERQAALAAELEQWKERSGAQASEIFELKERLAAAVPAGFPAEKYAALESAWQQERKAFLAELQDRQRQLEDRLQRSMEERAAMGTRLEEERLRAQESLAQLRELESGLSAAQEAARQAQGLAQRQPALAAELDQWKQKARGLSAELLEVNQRLSEAEREGLGAREQTASQSLWEEEKAGLLKELHDRQQKLEAGQRRSLELERLLADAEAARFQAQSLAEQKAALQSELEAWRQRAEQRFAEVKELRERLASVEDEGLSSQSLQSSWEAEKAGLLKELRDRQQKVVDQMNRALELEKRLAPAEQQARQAQQLAERQAKLQAELEEWRQKAHENLSRCAELERRLEAAKGAAPTSEPEQMRRMEEWKQGLHQREQALEKLERQIAEDYLQKQAQLEGLKRELESGIASLVQKQLGGGG